MVSMTSKSNAASSFNNVGIALDDIERGIDFYTQALGLRLIFGPLDIISDDSHFGRLAIDILGDRLIKARFAHLVGLNGVGLELFSFEDPEAEPREGMEYWKTSFDRIAWLCQLKTSETKNFLLSLLLKRFRCKGVLIPKNESLTHRCSIVRSLP